MARFEGLCGPGYATLSKAESVSKTVNMYFEAAEVPYTQKTDATLYSRPGSKPFTVTPQAAPFNQPVRGVIQFNGNGTSVDGVFGVSGDTFWQMDDTGHQTAYGTVADDGLPVKISANAATVGQIAVQSAGHLYILSGGTFSEIPIGPDFFGATGLFFMDGYFGVLSDTANHQQFQISALNDGLTWSGADVAVLLGQADPIVACIVNIEYIYFIGSRRGEIWYNSGNALFPFAIESGAFLEVGTNAAASVCQSSSTVYWIGQDARGANVAMRAQGLASQRISNHAVEQAWSAYSTTADCICYPLTWNGHSLIRYIFPTAGKGWEYDVTESARVGYQIWVEINFTLGDGTQTAPFERAHCYAFGKHLIGSGGADGAPGVIYEIDQNTFTDAESANLLGTPIDTGIGGALLVFPIDAVQTTMLVTIGPTLPHYPVPPFYLLWGDQTTGELMLCTALSEVPVNQAGLTVVRGLGGTTAQAWPAPTAFAGVEFPGFPITRDRICRLPFNGGLRAILNRLEAFIQAGVGNDDCPDPQITLRLSRDGGNTWGNEITVSMGQLGQYVTRVVWNRLGYYRDGAIWLRVTDPVNFVLAGGEYYIAPGTS